MQMQLPIFPGTTKLINSSVRIFEKDDFVYYLHNGSPVHVHNKDDINTYRFVTATLIVNHSCSATQLSEVFGVNTINFYRYAKRLREGGADAFFKPNDSRGQTHKMTSHKIKQAQECLNQGFSQSKTAKTLQISESAIRYHINKGTLKKNPRDS